jgi:protease I
MKEWGEEVPVDQSLDEADPGDYDALVLPGGVINADALRLQPKAVNFVKAFFDADKPVGVICHAPWTLIESGSVRGHKMTSWPSLKTDLTNAGAHWVDEEVVVDGNLVTSRKPDDLPAFNREITKLFRQARA